MIFTAPVDGTYEVDGGMIEMKEGQQLTLPDHMDIFRVVGGYDLKSRPAGPAVSEGIIGGHNA